MQFPRLVFFVAALTVTAIVMAGFTGYHVYQILTNQTTNERYKKYYLKKTKREVHANIYDRGILNNLFEEFFPQRYIEKVLKSSKSIDAQNGANDHRRHVGRVNEANEVKKRKRWEMADTLLYYFLKFPVMVRLHWQWPRSRPRQTDHIGS